uniref:HAMP domain-containing sensor histidine kinase n=1 Tax=Chryseobacterium endophyticum TaxID=1854762 RepID=A0AAU6WNT1_9FLAO
MTDRLEQTEMILENETSHQENLFQAITHDIATPIKHLSNLSQMMLDTDSPALQKKYFDSVYKSTEELYNLAMSLREYREAISSNEIFAEKAYSLHEAIERKIKLFADMSEYNATKIINTIDQDLVLSVKESIINIIIQNLLDNAVKNTAGGTIVFKGYREYPYIVIMLTDTGKGMPDEKLNYYNTLYQSNDEDETKFRNLGLGLHLVIRLVKKINAIIEFRKQTQGTLVIIKIIDICSKEF